MDSKEQSADQWKELFVGVRPSGDVIDDVLRANLRARLFGEDSRPGLGRLILLAPIGSGSMGSVVSAYDPVLDRRVAVKVLRRSGGAEREQALLEARALARLSHKHVVAVHDAGEVDDAVFLVMERVDGPSLARWLDERRSWPDVLRVLLEAGDGLWAAHRAGFVHGDFKPENVLVGEDGARVADFGLAAPIGEAQRGGTPGYRAPELEAGAEATALADQYSWFATLQRALYGSESDGDRVPSRGSAGRVPRWLRRALSRGLQRDPRLRYPDMGAVLAALSPVRQKRRRRALWAAAAAFALSATAGTIAYRRGVDVDLCSGGEERVRAEWSGDQRADWQRRLATIEAPYAASAAERLAAGIDGGVRAWVGAHERVCRRTRVTGDQSEALLDLRMRCLERGWSALLAWRDAVADIGDARELARAVGEAPDLDPGRCEALTHEGDLALPADPDLRRRVASEDRRLARAWADVSLGRYAAAERSAREILERTQDIEHDAFVARRDHLMATLDARSGRDDRARAGFARALQRSAAAGAPRLEAEISVAMVKQQVLGGSPATAIEWYPFAAAAVTRAGLGHAELHGLIGEAHRHLGNWTEADAWLERALEADGELPPIRAAMARLNRGSIALALDDPARAHRLVARAEEMAREVLGDGHPGLGLFLDKRAAVDAAAGDLAPAMRRFHQALSLREAVYGGSDRAVGATRLHMAEAALELGDPEAAAAHARQAEKILTSSLGAGAKDARLARAISARVRAAAGDAAAVDELRVAALELGRLPRAADESRMVAAWWIEAARDAGMQLPAERMRELAQTLPLAPTTDPEQTPARLRLALPPPPLRSLRSLQLASAASGALASAGHTEEARALVESLELGDTSRRGARSLAAVASALAPFDAETARGLAASANERWPAGKGRTGETIRRLLATPGEGPPSR